MRTCTILAALFIAPALISAEDKSPVKEVPLKGLKIEFPKVPGGTKKPEVVTSAAQLEESAALKGAADDIKSHVNFDKEKLVFVAWQGPSGDVLTPELKPADSKPPGAKYVLTFNRTPGKTTDLFKHARLFVVPKDTAVDAPGSP